MSPPALRHLRSLLLILLVLALIAPMLARAQVQTQTPMRGFMWEARKGDARVLLLGTIHVGRAGDTELTAAQLQRVRSVKAIALEANVFDAQRTLAAFQRYAFAAPDAPTDRTLPPALRARVEKLLPRFGLAAEGVWRLKPWAIANNLVVLEAARLGFSATLSTEAQLFTLSRELGLPIIEIESVEKQLAMFDSAPVDLQLAYLEQTVESVESGSGEREIRALLAAHRASDAAAMTQRLQAMQRSTNPGERWVGERVIDGRHPAMLAAIERFGASGRLHLVAVGSLHFFGPNGLIEGLRARGWTIEALR